MYIIIVGAGGIGRRLTERILKEGNHNIVVIDKDQKRCEEIAKKYDVSALNADTTQESALEESNIEKADVLVTTTDEDATNLMVISLAKNKGVNHFVSVVNQKASIPLYKEKGVKIVQSPHVVMAHHFYKAITHPNVEDYMNVGKHAEIFRLPIEIDSVLAEKNLMEIRLPEKSLIVAIERNDGFIIPTGGVTMFPGDKVTVLARRDQVDKVSKLFYKKSKEGKKLI